MHSHVFMMKERRDVAVEENKEREQLTERLTILHLGDVFLDGPVQRLRRDTREHRREELREAFRAFLTRVDEEKANLVIFSGNLLDGRYAGDETLRFLIDAFSSRPECHFVIAPGPLDPYDDKSIYRTKRFPNNVHIFFEEVLGCYNIPGMPLSVYGWSFRSENCTSAPLSGVHRTHNDRFTLLCGYTDGSAEKAPLDADALAEFDAHYTALSGKVHDGFHRAGNGIYSYSGSFEGRALDEVGVSVGGYIRISAGKRSDGWDVEAVRVSLETYSYVTARLDVSHLSTTEEVRPRLAAMIRENGYGIKTVLRVILSGNVPIKAHFEDLDQGDFGVYSLQVVDHTVPTDTDGTLLKEMTARGELYRHFYPQMVEGTEAERAMAARAFRVGYAALLGEEFSVF